MKICESMRPRELTAGGGGVGGGGGGGRDSGVNNPLLIEVPTCLYGHVNDAAQELCECEWERDRDNMRAANEALD